MAPPRSSSSSSRTALLAVGLATAAAAAALLVAAPQGAQAFTNNHAPLLVSPHPHAVLRRRDQPQPQSQQSVRILSGATALQQPLFSSTAASSSSSSSSSTGEAEVSSTTASAKEEKLAALKRQVREEGGRFAFYTKYGALNPFAIYYGLVAIGMGIPWFLALTVYQGLSWVTRGKLDRQRVIPVLLNHLWGVALMRLTGCYPKMENKEILKKFYQTKKTAMFVANHNSWMDIPFLGAIIGWRNYKIIAKMELSKVPILGKAIKVSGNIMVDRTDRRSQLNTLKQGMQYLKDGVHLCTFPEGTRTRTNRLTKFKNGAFKMAHKAGAPVVPISIVGAAKVHPCHWMFPMRPARGVAKVIVHEPVASEGATEGELAAAVRKSMISGLPPEQLPAEGE